MQTYTQAKGLIVASYVPGSGKPAYMAEPGRLFTDREAAALAQCIVTRGKRKGHWKLNAPKWGTEGYIAFQAKTMALDPYAMPSQLVMLFTDDQAGLFWSLTHKLQYLRDNTGARPAARVHLHTVAGITTQEG